jgi:hypothetical protein
LHLLADAVIERCYVIASDVKEKIPSLNDSAEKPVPVRAKTGCTSSKPTMCIYCKQVFSSKKAAISHIANSHKDTNKRDTNYQRIIKCGLCSSYSLDLRRHMLRMHADIVKMCKYERCTKFFTTDAEKLQHESGEHQTKENLLRCIYCDTYACIHRVSLTHHIETKHRNTHIRCNYSVVGKGRCAKYFLTEAEKSDHVKKVHKSRAYQIECKVCKEKLLQPHLNAHMRKFHNRSNCYTVSGETICCYCHEEFTSRKSAYRHVKEVHSNIKTFKCHECEICFENIELKSEHYQKVHRGQFRCIYCVNWECTNRMNLRRHMRKKHQGEVIQCKYSNKCSLYFKTQADLQQHISESHEAAKSDKLQCIYCSKFLPRNDLIIHIKIHHKPVAIKCNFLSNCPTYFLTKEDLERHIEDVHQPKIPFHHNKCPCCFKVFKHFCLVKKHVERVHFKSIFKCSLKHCRFVCVDSKLLEIHMKNQHSDLANLTKYQCLKCDFNSYNQVAVHRHELLRHGKENLECHFCPGRRFKSKLSIELHMKLTHSHFTSCNHCKI